MRRVRLNNGGGGAYFAAPSKLKFLSSGCKTLDLALGGGWAEDRIINIVGDKSTGKTLLCIEAATNFAIKYPKGRIRYRESEAAFDNDYASALGMPVSRVDFGEPMETVEDLFEDLTASVRKAKQPELFICDSLDALSDRSEMKRSMDEGTYGAEKAKKMSQLFRRLVRDMRTKRVTLIIVSQVRDKIGISFGRKTTRTGGRALDFYSSQTVYLAHIGQLFRTVGGIKRVVGVEIRAKLDKNKVGMPFREAQFPILFSYGVDDKTACIDWLYENKHPPPKGASLNELHKLVERRWFEIETSFLPKRSKYEVLREGKHAED